MKRVIDGKIYNTQTATCIAEYSNGLGKSDFGHIYEDLYKTPRGRYFVHGQGGPMSQYREQCGSNTWCGSSRIIPMSQAEALKWCEDHDIDGDTIIDEFEQCVEEA